MCKCVSVYMWFWAEKDYLRHDSLHKSPLLNNLIANKKIENGHKNRFFKVFCSVHKHISWNLNILYIGDFQFKVYIFPFNSIKFKWLIFLFKLRNKPWAKVIVWGISWGFKWQRVIISIIPLCESKLIFWLPEIGANFF